MLLLLLSKIEKYKEFSPRICVPAIIAARIRSGLHTLYAFSCCFDRERVSKKRIHSAFIYNLFNIQSRTGKNQKFYLLATIF